MNTSELLLRAAQAGIKFWLDGDKLAYRAPNGAMTDEFRSAVILHKADLIAMLRRERFEAASGIPRANSPEEDEGYLSSGQERLWLIDRRVGASPLYNLHFRLLWTGPLDREMLARSFTDIVSRHSPLRTTFIELDGVPQAVLSSAATVDLAYLDLRGHPTEARSSSAESFILDHQLTPFHVEKGPLMRAAVITLADDDHIVLVTQHHLVSDGWSIGIFVTEIGQFYRARSLGRKALLPDLSVGYSDYVRWQRERRDGPSYQERLAWWNYHLAGLSVLALPGARRGQTEVSDYHGAVHEFTVPAALASRLRDLAREQHCTLYTVLLTAWAILLHRYTSQSDFALGTVTSGRDQPELQNLIGFFANTMVLRCDLSANPRVVDAIALLRTETESIFEHEVEFADVVLAADAVPELNRTPLVKAAFIFENVLIPQILDPEIGINVILDPQIDGSAQGTSKFHLALFMKETPDGIRGILKYADSQFESSAFPRACQHFVALLESIAQNVFETVGRLGMMSAEEQQELLVDWNDTEF